MRLLRASRSWIFWGRIGLSGFNCGLPDLPADIFVDIPDSLPFIRLRRAEAADLRCDMADTLFINPSNRQNVLILLIRQNLHPLRDTVFDRMRESKIEDQCLPLDLRLVPDTNEFKLLLVSFMHPMNHIGNECTRKPMALTCTRSFGRTTHRHLISFYSYCYIR